MYYIHALGHCDDRDPSNLSGEIFPFIICGRSTHRPTDRHASKAAPQLFRKEVKNGALFGAERSRGGGALYIGTGWMQCRNLLGAILK